MVAQKVSKNGVLQFDALEQTLENNLRVIVVPTGLPHLVSLQIPVQTGSRNEIEKGKTGFAHFFEHMMFRGTEQFPTHKYQEIMTSVGARQNAYTTDDYTNYHATFSSKDLATVLELEANRFKNLNYSIEDFQTESRAVLGEYNKSSANPLAKLFEIQRDHAFTRHTYKHTTMGFLTDIEDMPNQFEYSREFFNRWYRPEYTSILITGDVEPKQTIELVNEYWGDWKKGSYTNIIPQEVLANKPVITHLDWETPTLPWVTIGFHGPAFSETEKDFAALDILMDLEFGETSEIYRQLVEEDQIVDQLFTMHSPHVDPSLTTVLARVRDIKNLTFVRDSLLKTISQLHEQVPNQERIDDAKSHTKYGFVRTLDNSESIASTLAQFVHFKRSYSTLNNYYELYPKLTRGDLADVARKYLTEERMVIATVSHDSLPETFKSPPKILKPKKIENRELPYILQKTPSPLLRFKLLFNIGSSNDFTSKEGIAALTASMITDASSSLMSTEEINRALLPLAGSFDSQVDKEMTVFTGVVHKEQITKFLDIVLPQLVSPGFKETDFERLKNQQENRLLQDLRANNEEELAKEELQNNIFSGTHYGHTVLGTVSGIQKITIDDIKMFASQNYSLENLQLGFAGDFSQELINQITAQLNKLPVGGKTQRAKISGRKIEGLEVEIIQKDTRATSISLGHPIDVTRSHPDFFALWLGRAWLGEHRSSTGRLFQQIRELRGLNYGDYAYIEAFPQGMYQFFPNPNLGRRNQIFEIWIRPVLHQNAHFTLKLALHELREFINEGLSEEAFERTRDYLEKNVLIMTKTQDQMLGYALDSEWYDAGDFITESQNQLKKLTRDSVNLAIKKHLSGKNLVVTIITDNAQEFKQTLTENKPATLTYDSTKPDDLIKDDTVIGELDMEVNIEKIRITPVETIFN